MPVDRRKKNDSKVIPPELERRRFQRREFFRSEVTLYVSGSDEEKKKRYICHDLSEGGMFIENPFPFPLNKVLSLTIKLPNGTDICLKGIVVSIFSDKGCISRSSESKGGQKIIELEENNLLLTNGNGIVFTEISEKDRYSIRSYLEGLQKRGG